MASGNHGCLWWLIIGWWWKPATAIIKLVFDIIYSSKVKFEFPERDAQGRAHGEPALFFVSGITHLQEGADPQVWIRKLRRFEQLWVVPDPRNPHDHKALMVRNRYGIRIGWVAAASSERDDIFEALQRGATVFARVWETEPLDSGAIGVTVEFAIYE